MDASGLSASSSEYFEMNPREAMALEIGTTTDVNQAACLHSFWWYWVAVR